MDNNSMPTSRLPFRSACAQMASENGRTKVLQRMLFEFMIVMILLSQVASEPIDSLGNILTRDQDDIPDDQLARAEPRQYFRVNVNPNQKTNRSLAKRRHVTNQEQQASLNKQTISSSTLKKLLNQSLMKPSNGSSPNYSKKNSNFKFVFIQRATKAPQTNTKWPDQKSTNSSSATQQSLASSVSKQLANSLLYSVSNMASNLTLTPSLTSLASQIVSHSIEPPSKPSVSAEQSSSSTSTKLPEDINKIQVADSREKKSQVNKQASKKSKGPSKIYNLPVKFVSNGQPTSVVLSTIRQHLATMKKLQIQSMGISGQTSKRRKQQQHHLKFKGNSRLIYLPLKYLSNARPNRIVTSKAAHKSE